MIKTQQNKFLKQYEATMYMDEIKYTYKPCKFVLMKSIHETKKGIFFEAQNQNQNQN